MADQPAQERTEEATAKRKQEARRKGTVTRSNDLVGSLVLLALILVFPAALGALGTGFMSAMTTGFRTMPRELSIETLGPYSLSVVRPAMVGLAYIAGTCLVVGLAANFAQVGFVFSGEALMPTFSKLNPANGFKRLFSISAIFEGLKAGAKAGLFIYLGWTAVQGEW